MDKPIELTVQQKLLHTPKWTTHWFCKITAIIFRCTTLAVGLVEMVVLVDVPGLRASNAIV